MTVLEKQQARETLFLQSKYGVTGKSTAKLTQFSLPQGIQLKEFSYRSVVMKVIKQQYQVSSNR